MPRTNVVGTTAPPGSGAQRCAQAGEREHRTDSTTGSAATTAAWSIRHYCRNLQCRSKLPAPIEHVRKAFCCRGCHSAFYRTRCLVCEKNTGTNPLTGEKRKRLGKRKFCGRKCKAEARQFPHVYAWVLPDPVRRTRSSSSCDKMGLKTRPASGRPTSAATRRGGSMSSRRLLSRALAAGEPLRAINNQTPATRIAPRVGGGGPALEPVRQQPVQLHHNGEPPRAP